jgi:multidrug efflux pump subunit AcrA (membrane-fusion protein)
MNAQKTSRGASLAGLFLPLSVLFGVFFWRFRKRHAVFTAVLLLLLAGTAMLVTSCGGLSTSTVAPGTYTIYVTGTGTATGVVHDQKVTLTIN